MEGKSELDGFDLSKGSFYAPTIVTDVETTDELWREEVFGPVVVLKRFSVSIAYFQILSDGSDAAVLKGGRRRNQIGER